MLTTLAHAISFTEGPDPLVLSSVIRIKNKSIVASKPKPLSQGAIHTLIFDEFTTDPCESGAPELSLETSERKLILTINTSSYHTLSVEAAPYCLLAQSQYVPSDRYKVLKFYDSSSCPRTEEAGNAGPITFFIAEARSRLHQLNKLLRLSVSEKEEHSESSTCLPVGFGRFIYSMPAFHKLRLSTKNMATTPIVEASVEPDYRHAYQFRVAPPRGVQGTQLFKLLLQEKTQEIAKKHSNDDIVVLVSGIDSFIPAMLLARHAKAFVHVVAAKHHLGIFQAYLVKAFFDLTRLSDKLVIINTKWGVFPKKPSNIIQNCEEYSLLGASGFLHKYFIDIIAREYIAEHFRSPVIVTGDTIGIFSAFNGTLQRDRPFLLGRLRGSLRRLLKSRFTVRVLAFLFAFRLGWEESYARSLAAIMFSDHSDGRFTSYIPSYSYLRHGFYSEPQHLYFISVVNLFSCSTCKAATDLAGAIGFLHRALYWHPVIRRGAELDAEYGMGHSFVNTSLAFVPFFSPRDAIHELLFCPKQLQYSILSHLISPLSWKNIFKRAVSDAPPKIIDSLDATYYNLIDRLRRGPLGY